MTELEKLKNYLDEHGYVSEWHEVFSENDQIIVYTEGTLYPGEIREPWCEMELDGKHYIRSWDVVCHKGSYGGPEGKLEIYGSVVNDVEGWLTAEDVINKYLKGDCQMRNDYEVKLINGESIDVTDVDHIAIKENTETESGYVIFYDISDRVRGYFRGNYVLCYIMK